MSNQTAVKREKDWVNIIFLTATPLIATIGTAWYTWHNGIELWMPILALVMYLLVGVSITAGYHRFFSHKSYEASRPLQAFFAFFGALAAQNSILWWSSAHRIHHKHVDDDWDPYNIRRGFWWAHIVWIFNKNPNKPTFDNSPDLLKNPIVMWQNRWHKVILIVGGFGIPALIGAAFGDWVAGLLWGGFVRLAVIHHTTFFVNSLAHFWGERTFAEEVSARDNWAVALVTMGEGYHSFHHRFPADFRNGIRWFHWDPAKWFIATMKMLGLAGDLRTTPAPMIEQARMMAAVKRVEARIETAPSHYGDEIRLRIANAREALEQSFALWRQHAEEKRDGLSTAWKATRRRSKLRLKEARRDWRAAMRMAAKLPETA